jgi:hypothetical protein
MSTSSLLRRSLPRSATSAPTEKHSGGAPDDDQLEPPVHSGRSSALPREPCHTSSFFCGEFTLFTICKSGGKKRIGTESPLTGENDCTIAPSVSLMI